MARGAMFASSLSKHNLPTLERWNSYLGYGSQRGMPYHFAPPPTTFMPSGQSFFGSMYGPRAANQGAHSRPVPVVITQMPKGQDRPNNVTTNVTVNVQSNANPQAIGGAVGAAVNSAARNALSDQHH
jgi:hypothetical protein